jgi:photosystem II stability/assembly factor-like uncharacterized protein
MNSIYAAFRSTIIILFGTGLVGTVLAQGSWTTKTDMPTGRFALSSATVNGKIYAMGGATTGTDWGEPASAIVEVYDPLTDSWDTTKAPMQTARNSFTSEAVGGKIYVFGGQPQAGTVNTATVEEYDPSTNAWTYKSPMPDVRAGLSSCVLNDKIYIIGGWKYSSPNSYYHYREVWEYNPVTDTWDDSTRMDMPTGREYLTTSVANEKIFAFGGWDEITAFATVEMYNPATNEWSILDNLPEERVYVHSATLNNLIYIFGGSTLYNVPPKTDTREYNSVFDSYRTVASMPMGMMHGAASVVNGKIYAFGGTSLPINFPLQASAKVYEFTPPTQWQLQTTLSGTPPVEHMIALDENILWISTLNGFAYRSTDGGQNWQQSTQVTSDENIFALAAIDSMTAFVCGGTIPVLGNAKIYRTTDGGQSWDSVYTATGPSTFWNFIHFFDTYNGIAMSDAPTGGQPFVIVKTTDGGENWTPISNAPTPNPNEFGMVNTFQFFDEMNGWFGTTYGGRIFRTTDGGDTWTGYPSGNTNGRIYSVNFVSPFIGVRACDESPYLTRTTDGGQTWTPVMNLPVSNITAMGRGTVASTPQRNQIWIHGLASSAPAQFIITSTDSGKTWQQQTFPPLSEEGIASFAAAVYGDSVRAWGATLDFSYTSGGKILTYIGEFGPITSVNEWSTMIASDYRLEQNYPNPFNPTTNIEFSIPKSEFVTLKVYNVLGEEVATLVSERLAAGKYKYDWPARSSGGDASRLASGVYLYRLKTDQGFSQTRKLVLLK